ncbi:MAG TPA: alpha/beta hydrolase [Acidimicrobiia bacterium]|nr:alpha/beta hydrolase [Acidimicrobiia bacterium]
MSVLRRVGVATGVAAGVAAGVAGTLYGTERAVVRGLRRRPDPDSGTLGALVFDEARRLPSHDGGSIFTAARGDGPTVLLSHGVTLTSRVWVKQFAELPERGVRVVAFDHRGHGDSLVGDTGHSVSNLGWDVRTVVEGLDLRDVVVVGHSMGGIALQAFAIEHPAVLRERVAGIVLLSTMARTPVVGRRVVRPVAEQLVGGFDLAAFMARPELGTALARIGFGRDPQSSHVELTRQLLASCPPETTRLATAALIGLDLTPDLPSIDVPTIVACGTRDRLTPYAESRRMAELIPGARLETFIDAGHMLMLERTERFDRMVLDFVREVGAAAGVARSA